VLFIKKKCTEIKDELKQKNSQFNVYVNSKNKREEKKKELVKNVKILFLIIDRLNYYLF